MCFLTITQWVSWVLLKEFLDYCCTSIRTLRVLSNTQCVSWVVHRKRMPSLSIPRLVSWSLLHTNQDIACLEYYSMSFLSISQRVFLSDTAQASRHCVSGGLLNALLEYSCTRIRTLCHTLETYAQYRVAKTHRIPYLYRSFSAKVTYI